MMKSCNCTAPKFMYQKGSTQVFQHGHKFYLWTVDHRREATWMEIPATDFPQAKALADLYELDRV